MIEAELIQIAAFDYSELSFALSWTIRWLNLSEHLAAPEDIYSVLVGKEGEGFPVCSGQRPGDLGKPE